MLVMLRQFGAGFLGATGPLGKRGLAMPPGQGLLHPPTPGNSLLRSKLAFFVPGLLVDAVFFLILEASRLKFLSYCFILLEIFPFLTLIVSLK